MEIGIQKVVNVNVKSIYIDMKVCDSFEAVLLDAEGQPVGKDYCGYVPKIMPGGRNGGKHYGDYLKLEIDLETGRILNWVPPTAAQLEEFLKVAAGGEED